MAHCAKTSHIFNGPTTPTYTNGWHLRHQPRGWSWFIGGALPSTYVLCMRLSPFRQHLRTRGSVMNGPHSIATPHFPLASVSMRGVSHKDRPQIGIRISRLVFQAGQGKDVPPPPFTCRANSAAPHAKDPCDSTGIESWMRPLSADTSPHAGHQIGLPQC
jgi:hypothetical protein